MSKLTEYLEEQHIKAFKRSQGRLPDFEMPTSYWAGSYVAYSNALTEVRKAEGRGPESRDEAVLAFIKALRNLQHWAEAHQIADVVHYELYGPRDFDEAEDITTTAYEVLAEEEAKRVQAWKEAYTSDAS